ncbi:MAG: hypothetical protein KC657_26790 [Myxococcales bacterium]|nr:hypothetical protein [Myxococcales bacterium]
MTRRQALVDAAALVLARALLSFVAIRLGFDHVSDDDFARVTIAQEFAHAPKLDPTGTSWLPLPFWLLGAVMMVLGRSLTVARVASVLFAALATPLPYLAMRRGGVARRDALLGVTMATLCPWSVWLGAATVPEAMAASLVSAGAIGLGLSGRERGADDARSTALWLACVAGACLSRYEAWPVAATIAAASVVGAWRAGPGDARRRALVVAALASAAPLAWMAWNAHAHDGPLHFFRRVSSYKRAMGEGTTDTLAALAMYPILLITTATGVSVPALLGLGRREVTRTWATPLACAAVAIAMLAYGNVRDGAPTHHPERALLVPLHLLGPFAAAALGPVVLATRRGRAAIAFAFVVWGAFLVRAMAWRAPAQAADEDRAPQVARGRELARRGVTALSLEPCAYEHYALIAGYGAPERVHVPRERALPTRTPDARCPEVRVDAAP